MCYTWYRVLILVPRVHVVYFSSLSQVVNYLEKLQPSDATSDDTDWEMIDQLLSQVSGSAIVCPHIA